MSNGDFFPSTGFEDALNKTQWGALQKYLAQASTLPKSPDPQTEAILEKVSAAAESCSTTVLPVGHAMGNTLYNYATTMVATLSGLEQLMGQDTPPKSAIEQLIGNLKTSAVSALADPQKASQGLMSFQNASSAAGHALAERLTDLKTKVSAANDTISKTSQDLGRQLTESNLDTSSVEADMEVLENTVMLFKGISFVGLTFSVEPGVTAATQLTAGVKGEITAWNTLIKQLSSLNVQITQSTEAELKTLPSLAPEILKDAQTRWQAVENAAHTFMLNFFVTPTEGAVRSLSAVQGHKKERI